VFNEAAYQEAAQKALKQAQELLIAEEAPAGVMDVVLSPGWAAVILHEAVGHGLEGDFNRRDISVYSGKIGQKVAAAEVTVVDQGDMPGERGSLHFDDEGTPTKENVLIENGILKAYMQDRQNAQLMKAALTGNGRRESYAHVPMPRMTNTYFRNGTHDPADIIKSVKDGLYIADMGGGQVDITSGKFNMNATLAYRIRNGKLCEPVKGVTLVGDGLTVIQSITMVGNDLKIEKSAGACGKNGQSVTVSCGQPTIRVANMTIGGSKK
ncbi:MAG: metalloprotease TldD, partial [Alphaproteobacteria bacterium]|nr:metalloprotease TldD [Alphaproteobacteria bacterium]